MEWRGGNHIIPADYRDDNWSDEEPKMSVAEDVRHNWPEQELDGAPRTRECLGDGKKTIGQIRSDLERLCVELERELRVARERYDYVRGLNVPEFQRLFTLCMNGERFDDLVDEDLRWPLAGGS